MLNRRLLPVNAFIALLTRHDVWPAALDEAGYRLAGLEVPVSTEAGSTRLDAVAVKPEANRLLVAECKSGGNVDLAQARRLAQIDPAGLVRTASVTVESDAEAVVDVVYVSLEEHADRIVSALGDEGLVFPVLAVATDHVEHLGAPLADPDVAGRVGARLAVPGPPPELLRFDGESTTEDLLSAVRATLVEQQAHRREIITVRAITEHIIPQYAYFGKKVQGHLRDRVEQAARRVAEELPEAYGYRPKTEGHDEAAIRVLETPETLDPRGRTQSYQRISRAAQRKPRRLEPPPPGHMRLFEELDDIVANDEGDDADDREPKEET